jgi:hypothetical protein
MKNLVIGMLLLGLTNLGYSQGSSEPVSRIKLGDASEAKVFNKEYRHNVQYGTFSSKVIQLENMLAQYDYTKSPFSKSPINHLTFKKGNDFVMATFDARGRILRSHEKYRDIAVPVEVRNLLFREHPGWTMTSNTYVVRYGPNMQVQKTYKIVLEKDDLRKTVLYDSRRKSL